MRAVVVAQGLVASERDKDSGTGALPAHLVPSDLLRF